MGRNPFFGCWATDDDPADNWESSSSFIWDLRTAEKEVQPCTVKLGNFVLKDVYFPRKEALAQKIKEMAQDVVAVCGYRNSPEEYPVPAQINKRYVQYFRYCIARILADKNRVLSGVAAGE